MKNILYLVLTICSINFAFSQSPYYVQPATQTVTGYSGEIITANVVVYRAGGPNNQPYYFKPVLCEGDSNDIYDLYIENGGVVANDGGYVGAQLSFRRNASSTFETKTYKFKFQDLTCSGSKEWYCFVTVNYKASCALPAPSSFSSSNVTTNSVTLSWSDVSAADYRIYYKKDSDISFSTYVVASCCTQLITGLQQNTKYNFKIVPICYNSGLQSSNTKTIDVTTKCLDFIPAPTNITATLISGGYIINCTPPFSYDMEYVNLVTGSFGNTNITTGSNTNVGSNFFYYIPTNQSFKFRLKKSADCSLPSEWVTVIPSNCPTNNFPSNLIYYPIGGSTPGRCCGYGGFKWDAVSGAIKYKVEYMGINLTNPNVQSVSGSFETGSINGTQPTLYACSSSQAGTWIIKFRVQSKCSNGTWSDYSPWSANFAW